MAQLTYREAVVAGLAQEMERDERVYFIGEDVAAAGGVFKTTGGCWTASDPRGCATRRSASRRSWGR